MQLANDGGCGNDSGPQAESMMKFKGSAYVHLSRGGSYLCMDTEDRIGVVLRVGNPGEAGEHQELANALNAWADKEPIAAQIDTIDSDLV